MKMFNLRFTWSGCHAGPKLPSYMRFRKFFGSWYDSLDDGSARLKASAYIGHHNTERRGQHPWLGRDSNSRSQYPSAQDPRLGHTDIEWREFYKKINSPGNTWRRPPNAKYSVIKNPWSSFGDQTCILTHNYFKVLSNAIRGKMGNKSRINSDEYR
jgi:hypothetical protein